MGSTKKDIAWAVNEIKSLNVQGAMNVALFSLDFLKSLLTSRKSDSIIVKELLNARKYIPISRATEPAMRNSYDYVFKNFNSESFDRKRLLVRVNTVIQFIKKSDEIISEFGYRKIKSGDIVYTHCHSSTVIDILKKAHDNRKHFVLRNTETRPLFQGRKTAKEMANYGVYVEHYVDSAMRVALKKSDIIFLGADAITDSKIFNKIGSEIICELAHRFDIPVYICTLSWKYDPYTQSGNDEVIEERSRNEIWPKSSKKIHIRNPAFEKINPELITGIISELGILPYNLFLEKVREKYSFMNRDYV